MKNLESRWNSVRNVEIALTCKLLAMSGDAETKDEAHREALRKTLAAYRAINEDRFEERLAALKAFLASLK